MGLREQAAEERFKDLVLSWLESLPAEGWVGTSKELGDDIAASRTVRQFVPRAAWGAVRDLLPAIRAAGWCVAERRTKEARLIVFGRKGEPR